MALRSGHTRQCALLFQSPGTEQGAFSYERRPTDQAACAVPLSGSSASSLSASACTHCASTSTPTRRGKGVPVVVGAS